MSTLIRDRRVEPDDYTPAADDAQLPLTGKYIVSLERWRRDMDALKDRPGLEIGVRIPNTVDVLQLWSLLEGRPLVALEFPAFPDGRAYTQARILRQRCKFGGEIRATGAAVVRDQLFGMARCGFNSFELRADQDAAACLAGLHDFSIAYQPAQDHQLPIVDALRKQTRAESQRG